MTNIPDQDWISQLRWGADGLLPAIAQDIAGKVLMFAWVNAQSLQLSLEHGHVVYWSRSRNRLWVKGEESGHFQKIIAVHSDCDLDVLLFTIEQVGGIACHTGRTSCFFNKLQLTDDQYSWREEIMPIKDPKEIYQK